MTENSYKARLAELRKPAVDFSLKFSPESIIWSFVIFFIAGGLIFGVLFFFIINISISDTQATIISAVISGFFGILIEVVKSKKE